MIALLKKYKWYLIALVVLYAAIALALFLFTNTPQEVPFEYQFK